MARRKENAKARMSKKQEFIINSKHLGDEPILKEGYTSCEMTVALNWCNYMYSVNDARKFIEEYLKSSDRKEDLVQFNRVNDSNVTRSVAWVARLINNGSEVSGRSIEYFEELLGKILSSAEKPKKVVVDNIKETKKVISIQERMAIKSGELIAEIEELVDHWQSKTDFSFYEWLVERNIPAAYGASIINYYGPILMELVEAKEGECDQLNEAYSYLKKKELTSLVRFIAMIVDDTEKYSTNVKKTRKPSKPRKVSVEKKLKNLKYKKEDKEYKIASINPEKMLGSQEVWMFNTKYKTITVIRAMNHDGIQVKGTSLINYDVENSQTKRTGRKAEHFISRALNGGKVVLRKLMDEMDKETNLAYRLNENTIILRVC